MKKITIYFREVYVSSRFSKRVFRKTPQLVLLYNGKEYRNGHEVDFRNPRLQIPFAKVLETRSKKELEVFMGRRSALPPLITKSLIEQALEAEGGNQ